MIYIKFILGQLKVLGMIIFSAIFVYPLFVYPNRLNSWRNRFGSFRNKWYWDYADTEGEGWNGGDREHYLNATYGLYELCKKRDADGNWIPDYRRFNDMNSIQQFILAYRWGVNGAKYFRYSFTKKLFGDRYVNFMVGASTDRYLIKFRMFDIKDN